MNARSRLPSRLLDTDGMQDFGRFSTIHIHHRKCKSRLVENMGSNSQPRGTRSLMRDSNNKYLECGM
jgi:hypothetical protein